MDLDASLQLPLRAVVAAEFVMPCGILFVLAFGYLVEKNLAKALLGIFVTLQVCCVALRPPEYNSDTWNYFGYIDMLSNASGSELLAATKFEPLHLAFAIVAQNFRAWLFLESMCAIALTWILIRRTARVETLAVVFGCAIPLMSSSLRFAQGLLLISCLLASPRGGGPSVARITIAGGISHVSLAVAGLFRYRKWQLTCLVLASFFVVAMLVSSVLERAGVSEEGTAGPAGLRSFVCLLATIFYLRSYLGKYRRTLFASDFLSASAVFLLSFFFFPVINRWLILMLIMISVSADHSLQEVHVPRPRGHLFAAAIYCALLIPFLASIGLQMYRGEYFVG
jgi:hypothetical protein